MAVVAVLVLAAAVAAEPVVSCSCVRPDAREWLAEGRPAFVGEVISKRRVGGGGVPVYEYRVAVERQFNAELGPELTLRSPSSEASCGWSWDVGDRVGGFLYREDGRWATNLCLLVGPVELERGLAPFPAPVGPGRVALVAAGDFGRARLMALDTRGRILAYGEGRGATTSVSICPGSRRLAELVQGERGARIEIRALRSMRVLRSVRTTIAAQGLRCQNEAGGSVAAWSYHYAAGRTFIRVLRLRGARITELAEVTGDAATLGRRSAYVAAPDRVLAVDLATGAIRQVATARSARYLALSPDGRRLALLDSNGVLQLVELAGGRTRSERIGLWGPIAWLGPRRLLARLGGGEIRVYDGRLRRVATHGPYRAEGFARVGNRLFGVNGLSLVSLDLRDGARTTVAELPDRDVNDLEPVPGRPLVARGRRTLERLCPGAA